VNKVFLVTLDTGKKIVYKDETTMFYGLQKIAEANFECYNEAEHEDHAMHSGYLEDTDTGVTRVFVQADCLNVPYAYGVRPSADVIVADFDEIDFVG
jgi:hypothetical protein